MNKHRYKVPYGDSHVLIVFIIIIFLVGVLGFEFWSIYTISKSTIVAYDKSSTGAIINSSETAGTRSVSINPSLKQPITFTYPSDWIIKRTTDDNVYDIETTEGGDYIKIFSPSKQVYVEVSYTITSSGYDSECGEGKTQKYVSLTPTVLTGYSEKSFFEAIVNSDNKGYFFSSYIGDALSEGSKYTVMSRGYCVSNAINLIKRLSSGSDNKDVYVTWGARIVVDGYPPSYGYNMKLVEGVSEINEALVSDEYKTAKSVLLSAKIAEQ